MSLRLTVLAAVAIVGLAALCSYTAKAQRQEKTARKSVPCWSVPNGVNNTIQCANGYWQTITPEGEVFTGNGTTDPSASAQGSGIAIHNGTITLQPSVTAPTQILPTLEPYQAQQYGFQPRLD